MSRAQLTVSVAADTMLPRDRLVNTLHFETQFDPLNPFSTDWNQLCQDLAEVYDTHWQNGTNREIVVKAYNDEGPQPHYPIGEHTMHEGGAPASNLPREVALCLSFYADRNIPRHRGRIYLPLCTAGVSSPDVRPGGAIMDKALAMAGHFSDLGGSNVNWQVYSPTDATGRTVTHAWVDNEWDTMRSRGMRATDRVTADQTG